tara:strand:+ start:11444 stop:11665 length:222 start_codon:yes stop_codon:yes gene_type:complete
MNIPTYQIENNMLVIIPCLEAYGPCSIEWLVKYCLEQKETTREAVLAAVDRIGSRPEATVEDGYLMFEGLGGC